MEGKINTHLFIMGLVTAILVSLITWLVFFNAFQNQVNADLKTDAQLIATSYDYITDDNNLKDFAKGQTRITLIKADGNVIFDSEKKSDENHLERSEIKDALQEGEGYSSRYSETTRTNTYYYAMKLSNGNILRVAKDADALNSVFTSILPYMILIFIMLLIMSLAIGFFLTKKIINPITKLSESVDDIGTDIDADDIYPELSPFITEIIAQKREIRYQLGKVEREKNKVAAIIQNMSEGMILLDLDKNILLMNEATKRIFNVGDVTLKHDSLLYISRDKDVNDCVDKALDGENSSLELMLNGRIYQMIANPVASQGEQIGVICLIIDITEKKEMESMRQEFTANVSHELKTPLTSISGYAEMIEAGIVKEEDIKNFAGRIRKESARLLSLISDIILLSRLDNSQKAEAIRKETVNLLTIAQKCADDIAVQAERQGVVVRVSGEEYIMRGNITLLTELVQNLCDNAVRYNRDKDGKVDITVGNGFIDVKDTGIGIPPEHRARIFERFYRVDKSRSKERGGTGLGLAIVKHICELYDAKIELKSSEGFGTEIKITF
ncbi:PAS domain-containing protein [Clostridium sp. AM09-51]|uniref:sensor histidine kinase n=1 Tax=Pseudoruminococcus massiliensis TaxID=2086583 RepID=UPI000E5178AA|nr:ATP-binding protein [Pseudoruminococcus massiliensis]RHO47098.1 PAS domain-containing protein [Clostridium sp. AM09-51]